MKNPVLRATLIFSAIFHLALFTWFFTGRRNLELHRSGKVAVEVVFAAEHSGSQTAIQTPGPAKAKHAKREKPSPAPVPAGPVASASAATSGAVFDQYVGTIMMLINRYKLYPNEAVEREEEGRVVIGMTIEADGAVSETRLEESSPFQSLNDAAMETIRRIGKFPPLAEGLKAPLHLHVPLVYKIQRR